MKRVEITDSRGDFTLSEALFSIDTVKRLQEEVSLLKAGFYDVQFYV